MNYQEAWSFLDNLQFFKIKLGLDSMTMFLESLGQPQKDLRFVHVAGTNGKGSVSVTLLKLLSESGYRVGLYTSPHLSSVRERFRINDAFISCEDFAKLATRIHSILDGRQITYFEFTTALALLWFAERDVDLAILEVGLGGRLDATNVITPLVSIITNVSMDHEAYLGNTLAAVASEKAGIVKPDVPVVSGVTGEECLSVVKKVCRSNNAPLYLLGRDFHVEPRSGKSFDYIGIQEENTLHDLECRMLGSHQRTNAALALAAQELLADHGMVVSNDTARKALLEVSWPGRLEYFCLDGADKKRVPCQNRSLSNRKEFRQFLLDGAHNPDGVASLKSALNEDFEYNKLIMVWASMSDKDIAATLSLIAPVCDDFILTMPESERSAKPEQLLDFLPMAYREKARCICSVEDALSAAQKIASPDDLICIAGSLYLVGAARKLLLGEVIQ
jgi:dihydrofolate synthase/folylpolyglutamate synthase